MCVRACVCVRTRACVWMCQSVYVCICLCCGFALLKYTVKVMYDETAQFTRADKTGLLLSALLSASIMYQTILPAQRDDSVKKVCSNIVVTQF